MSETCTMKMALASKEDFEAAYDLLGLLDNIDRGYYPANDEEKDAPTFLDEDDPEHLRVVYDRLKEIIDRRGSGAFHRIIGGFSMVCSESNRVLDPASDVVELHPQIKAALAAHYEGIPVAAYSVGDRANGIGVLVQRARQVDDSYLWKVTDGASCLNKSGEWEYEPLPSSRDDDFMARCRFATADEAIEAARKALREPPCNAEK